MMPKISNKHIVFVTFFPISSVPVFPVKRVQSVHLNNACPGFCAGSDCGHRLDIYLICRLAMVVMGGKSGPDLVVEHPIGKAASFWRHRYGYS
ncbi:MAG: hypothetical protein PVH87_17375 [Desulfobacteraceae bacterium]|jgi:hypothetical protein